MRIPRWRDGSWLGFVFVLACARPEGRPTTDSPVAATRVALRPPIVWRFEAPPAWGSGGTRRVAIAELDSAELAASGEGVLSVRQFVYVPSDTTFRREVLLVVYVYDSTAWARVAAEPGPPQGNEILRAAGLVYIASLPQSNPFAPASADARAFDSLSVSLDYVKGALHVVK